MSDFLLLIHFLFVFAYQSVVFWFSCLFFFFLRHFRLIFLLRCENCFVLVFFFVTNVMNIGENPCLQMHTFL